MSADSQVLGVAHEHDAGVALIRDGRLAAAVNEERFNREKFTTAMPQKALAWLRSHGGLEPSKVGTVALGGRLHVAGSWWEASWFTDAVYEVLSITRMERVLFGTTIGTTFVTNVLSWIGHFPRLASIRRLLAEQGIDTPIRVVEHHHAHAVSACVGFGLRDGLVITLDAQGDGDCSRVYDVRDGHMTLVQRIPFFHSPGNYYEYVTHILGFKPGREGKVTGLAARGDAEKTIGIFRERMTYDEHRMRFHNRGSFRLAEIRFLKNRLKGFSREDIAAGVQRHLEELVMAYVRQVVHTTGRQSCDIVLAGGVFANVKLNQCIAELPEVTQTSVFPHMGDGGLAAGAAMAICLEQGISCAPIDTLYLGPTIDDAEAEAELKAQNLSYERPEKLADAVADRLARGQVVAVCRSGMEYGPRALGNRTILYQATDPSVNDWLNVFLKRSEFMPFAPILKEADYEAYFEGALEQSRRASRYMTMTLNGTERCRHEAPAIVHVDGTARPQLVTADSNPFIHDVLNAYHARTNLRVLINTSFNMHEEPIVCSPRDGVRAFLDGRLDVLVLGSFIVTQPNPRADLPRD